MGDDEKLHRIRRELGGELAMLRGRTKMTQEEFATLIGVHSVTLRYWEIGKYVPSASKLQMLIEALALGGFFSDGKEQEEIRKLWNMAREAGLKSTPDEEWLAELRNKYLLPAAESHNPNGAPRNQEPTEGDSPSTSSLPPSNTARYAPSELPEKIREDETLEDKGRATAFPISNPMSHTGEKISVLSRNGRSRMTNHFVMVLVAMIIATAIIAASFILKSSPGGLSSSLVQYAPYGGTLIFEDPLRQNVDLRWEVGQDSSGASPGGCSFNGRGYYVYATNYYHQCDDQIDDFDNFALQVKMELGKGSEGGVLFRTNNPSDYYFGIDDSGNYEILRFGSAQPHIIREITERNSPRQSYVLAIVANGPSIDIYVDGLKLDHFSDKTYTHGHFSLFADGSYQPHIPKTEATFTDLKVWRL